MIERGLGLLVAAAVCAGAMPASAVGNVRREVPSNRPYIIEVGEPYEISTQALQGEADNLSELREYLRDYGQPDYAEIQEIEPQWPWAAREVRTYYLRRNLEVDFGHVMLSRAAPQLGVVVFLGQIPPDKAHEIEVILEARQAPPPVPASEASAPAMVAAPPPNTGGLNEALVARIEAAAERAAQAADRAVSESYAAVSAAERAEHIVNKLEEDVPRSSRRR